MHFLNFASPIINLKDALINFNKIYNDFYKRSFLFAKSYVGDDVVAQDIASDSLIALWQTMKKEEVIHPLSLLLTILRNNSLNHLKSQERKAEAIEIVSSVMKRDLDYRINSLTACDPQEIFSSEITAIIEQTLSSLSEQTRCIFEMSRYEQRSVQEIANECSITTKAVEYHITKSLKVLRLALKDYLPFINLLFINDIVS